MSKKILTNDWAPLLEDQFKQPYYLRLRSFLKEQYQTKTIFPPMEDIYNALHYTPFSTVKVAILGQDPYHGPNQAHGFSFSVKKGVPQPPSLKNIFKELANDLGYSIPTHGDLTKWTKQGVLLLNTVLTVEQGKAHAHREQGWEQLTDTIIQTLNLKKEPIVYILWGKVAQQKIKLIDMAKHFVITSVHPSPLSAYRGFFGSKPFSKANALLKETGQSPIDWEVLETDA